MKKFLAILPALVASKSAGCEKHPDISLFGNSTTHKFEMHDPATDEKV
jgi:hypothetical protein